LIATLIVSIACFPQESDRDKKPTEQELAKILDEMKGELKDESYSYDIVDGLFVCASNAGKKDFDRAKKTITNVVKAIYKDFVSKKLTKPLKVYLFKGPDSYNQYCKDVLKQEASTPFGFYLSGDGKMVMDISTGTGTLAHELVHPMIMNDFKNIPSWFNEGFASLAEQSSYTDDGSIKGLVNWRLPKLQERLDQVSIEKLMKTSDSAFRSDAGINYAIARYLCMYLQEQGTLKEFYKTFRDRHFKDEDKTGIKTLKDVMKKEMDEIEKDWKAWIKTLKWK
jgi:hypothetical protein